jgi:hypothetical protein
MNFWNKHDLAVMATREKIINLTNYFKKKFSGKEENYESSLDNFLKKNLNKECNFLLKTSMAMTINSINPK